MGYTRIETVTDGGRKSWVEIATEGLYEIVCPSGRKIVTQDKISDICFCGEFLVLRTEDRDFRNGNVHASFVKDNREVNNIDAFDLEGNHLWNIGELVGDIKMAFDGFTHVAVPEAEQEFDIVCGPEACLFKCIACGTVFLIDGRNRKCLLKVTGMVK